MFYTSYILTNFQFFFTIKYKLISFAWIRQIYQKIFVVLILDNFTWAQKYFTRTMICEQLHVRERSFANLNLPEFALKVDLYTNIHKSK